MISEIIDKVIDEERNIERQSSGKFHISKSGQCRLQRYWLRQNKQPAVTPDARTLRTFAVGKLYEDFILDKLNKNGIFYETQGLVEDEHRKGFYDLITYETILTPVLWEVKTQHSRSFWHAKKEGGFNYKHHRYQLVTYHSMLPVEIRSQTSCRLCYVSKDDLMIEEVGVNPESLLLDVLADWDILIKAWITQTQPKANPEPWECRYCSFEPVCEEKLIPEKKTKKKKEAKDGQDAEE